MAKDDMSLLMFKVLSYLYKCVVKGKSPNPEHFKVENHFFCEGLTQEYLNFICLTLEEKGYTKGFSSTGTWGGGTLITSYDAKITPEGFEYMKENRSMEKAYNYLKEVKGWIPFF